MALDMVSSSIIVFVRTKPSFSPIVGLLAARTEQLGRRPFFGRELLTSLPFWAICMDDENRVGLLKDRLEFQKTFSQFISLNR